RIDELLTAGGVLTTGMVRLELLAAIADADEFRLRARQLNSLPSLETSEDRWSEAAALGSALRRAGITVPSTDLLISAVAIAAGATLVHRDHHFDLVASAAPLSVESY